MPDMPPELEIKPRLPNLWQALIPVLALIVFLGIGVGVLGVDPHIPLILGTAVAAGMGYLLGHRNDSLQDGMVRGIQIALLPILILLVIGVLIGLWISAGIVPILIDYGLKLLNPQIFLPVSCLICAIVSLSTGSSWTTAGTVGIALIGVGTGLGISPAMSAGAIISGAYFGDKMSPLSDTTNLAPAVAGSKLFEHIRHMAWTTGPSFVIALIAFSVLGLSQETSLEGTGDLNAIIDSLESLFNLTPWLLVPPATVLLLVILKMPALPALFLGALVGGVFAVIFQGQSISEVLTAAMYGFTAETGNAAVDDLVSRGGMESMFWTVGLILCAMAFGGIMEKTRMLEVISSSVLSLARNTGSLILTTAGTCFGMNALASDQYLALVVPGRMYREAFAKRGLHPKNLSRILEDAGTLTSPLIFWNTCGATMSFVLGVSAGDYWMFCFFNLINPFVSILYGYMGWTMVKLQPEGESREE